MIKKVFWKQTRTCTLQAPSKL